VGGGEGAWNKRDGIIRGIPNSHLQTENEDFAQLFWIRSHGSFLKNIFIFSNNVQEYHTQEVIIALFCDFDYTIIYIERPPVCNKKNKQAHSTCLLKHFKGTYVFIFRDPSIAVSHQA